MGSRCSCKMCRSTASFGWVMILGPNDIPRLYFALDPPGGAHSWVLPGESSGFRFILITASVPAEETNHFPGHANKSQRTESWGQRMVYAGSFLYSCNLSLWLPELNALKAQASPGPTPGIWAWGHGAGRVSLVYLMDVDQKRSDCSLIVKSEYILKITVLW